MRSPRAAHHQAFLWTIVGLLLVVVGGLLAPPPSAQTASLVSRSPSGWLTTYAVNPLDPTFLKRQPNGEIWFASFRESAIGHLDPITDKLTAYSIPGGNVNHIAPDADGNIWYSLSNGGTIGKLDPRTGKRGEWNLGFSTFSITVAPTGEVWFERNRLYRLDPKTNHFTLYPSTQSSNQGVHVANDGSVWFLSFPRTGVGRLNPKRDTYTVWDIPHGFPRTLYVESSDSIWIVQHDSFDQTILRLIPSTNTFHEYALPTPISSLNNLSLEGDYLWFTESGLDKIGYIDLNEAAPRSILVEPSVLAVYSDTVAFDFTIKDTPIITTFAPSETRPLTGTITGSTTEFLVSSNNSLPWGIASTPGVTWFSLASGNRIGRLVTPVPTLAINHLEGAPGSFFTLRGANFPSNTRAVVTVNGTVLTDTLPVAPDGTLAFQLDTSQGAVGRYTVAVSVGYPALAGFALDPAAPVHPAQSTQPILVVPGSIAFPHTTYLPLVAR